MLICCKHLTSRLTDVYVLQEHRGKGLAKRMIQLILSRSKIAGLKRTALVAQPHMVRLYKDCGFTSGTEGLQYLTFRAPTGPEAKNDKAP